ncbi:MAG TPA: hypothetical protein VIA62_10720 [Thermoanaerobaculia bacterium]|jgi:hypothetical protein|nr:hypothetical protein [Thermoanaerobaculia bacterium]
MKNVPPWLALVLGLMVGFPAARLVVAPADKPAPAATTATTPAVLAATSATDSSAADVLSCQGTAAAPAPAWCEPVQLLGELFGRPLRGGASRDKLAGDLAQTARAGGYDLRFLVALVPAPPDPRLDQALEAVQRGFAQSGYLVDRVWLPWTGDGANRGGGAAQTAPGLLLFRRQEKDGAHSLALVFLVGETPKAGIQKAPFREALDLVADLQGAAGDPTVSLLGPSFSGSVESLRLALLSWKASEGEHQRRRSLRFRAATGSATAAAKDVEDPLATVGVDVCRTVLPDETLHERTFRFLQDEMGWDLRRVALLTEADTAYGRNLLEEESGGEAVPHAPPVMVPFPSHISELRYAAEREKAKAGQGAKSGAQPPIPAGAGGRQDLELDLSDPGRPADLVPTYNPLTVLSNELMLENLLQAVSREGIRYVGIVATDVRDKLFLAEEVRARVPDAVLFTFDNDLLYAHSQYVQILDGMLVFSSAPLITEGAPWVPASLTRAGSRMRRQFTSELQQGLYEAVRHLLGQPVVRPRAWIMAVGNGSLWPIARLEAPLPAGAAVHLCAATPGPQPATPAQPARRSHLARPVEGNGFAGKDDLQVLLVAVLLSVFAWRLRRAVLLEPVAGSPLDYAPGNRRLLAAGTLLLALAAGVLLAVGSVPSWARGLSLERLAVDWQPVQILYLTALAFVYFLLAGAAALAVHRRLTLAWAAVWAGSTVAVLALLALGLRWLCMPEDQVELFHLRARAFSSGLSPLVSLAAVGWAVYAWTLWELKRRRLMMRQSTDCPVEALGDPAISGAAPVLKVIHDLLAHTLPTDRRLWLLPAVAFIPPVSLLWSTVQPVAETKGFGRLFILFLVLALALAALSYYRFFRLWVWTLRILHRLDNASPRVAEAFQAVAKDLEWRPIQSFGWQIPAFKTPTVSVRRLRALAAAGKVRLPEGAASLDDTVREIFEKETDDGSPGEIEARNRLEKVFTQVCLDLHGHLGDPEVRQFVALRVAAWLRYVFAHMRSCLIGALASGLLSLVGVTAYAFQPRHFVSLAIWLALAAAVGLTLLVFVQMDRNATLSRIGDTTPGKVTFDRTFFSKLFTFVGLPVLGLVATQFPEVGHLLGGLAGQLLRIAGGG